jgi:putative membrane-bound dehydrogenase-like protein
VNGLTWGGDGWVYGANGRSDGDIRRPDEFQGVSLRGLDFRFRPDTGEYQTRAGRSQFGLGLDDWGNRFLSWNTIPARHDGVPLEYLLKNPRLSTSSGVVAVQPAEDDGRVFPRTPTPKTFNQESTAHYNALAGLIVFRGDALPPGYAGNLFVGETLRNLVHRRILQPRGSSFTAVRGEKDREFLASTDPWFHPVNFATGPRWSPLRGRLLPFLGRASQLRS